MSRSLEKMLKNVSEPYGTFKVYITRENLFSAIEVRFDSEEGTKGFSTTSIEYKKKPWS